MKIDELMTRDPVAVGPDTPLRDVAAILVEKGISGVPVIGERLEVLGVVSEADIVMKEQGPESGRSWIAWLLGGNRLDERKLVARTAGEAMTSPPITTRPEAHVADAARTMTEWGIKRLPVVDRAGTLVGIVTRTDLVRAFARPDTEIEREVRDLLSRTLWIEEPGVDVGVEKGEARLSGRMRRRSDVELLEHFTARVPGVVAVHSTLRWAWDDSKVERDNDMRVLG